MCKQQMIALLFDPFNANRIWWICQRPDLVSWRRNRFTSLHSTRIASLYIAPHRSTLLHSAPLRSTVVQCLSWSAGRQAENQMKRCWGRWQRLFQWMPISIGHSFSSHHTVGSGHLGISACVWLDSRSQRNLAHSNHRLSENMNIKFEWWTAWSTNEMWIGKGKSMKDLTAVFCWWNGSGKESHDCKRDCLRKRWDLVTKRNSGRNDHRW